MIDRVRGLFALASLGVILTSSATGAADATPQEKASAEALFQDAMKLMAERQFGAACPKLEESQRLDPGMGTQFRLAECYEAVGRTASAWGIYVDVADAAKNAGQAERERVARERASGVERKLSRLTIVVTAPEIPGLEVRRSGVLLGKPQWGSAVPVDPAAFEITASAPGKVAWTGRVSVAGDASSATLAIPALEDAPVVALPVVAPPEPSRLSTATDARVAWSYRKTLAIASGVVGVAGIGVGSAFGVETISAWSSSRSLCSATACPSASNHTQAVSDQQTASSSGVVSTVAFGLGAAALAGAVVLWLTAPSASSRAAEDKAARVRVVPGLGTREGQVVLMGSF